MKYRPPCLAWASMLIVSSALAQPASYFAENEVPDPSEVARLLSRPQEMPVPATPRVRTRAVRLLEPAAVRAATPGAARVHATGLDAPLPERFKPAPERVAVIAPQRFSSVGSLAIAMRFNSNSTEVMDEAASQLDAVAAGIKRLPNGGLIVIEGHTDAYGADEYNRELSLRRAFAVRRYLVERHHVPGTMLVAIGRGESAPLKGTSPYAAANRRVEFHAEYEMKSASAAQALSNPMFTATDRRQ